jgi:UDP-GlcNAc:undecaprenyl-phosphate GlcNAc-1-phosphate transferase
VTFTFYTKERTPLYAYFVPLVVLAVPIFDTAAVVIIRLSRGRPIFEGDRNHLAHRLLALGLSPRATVAAVYAIAALTGLSALLLYLAGTWGAAALIFSQLALVFVVVTLLEAAGRARGNGS